VRLPAVWVTSLLTQFSLEVSHMTAPSERPTPPTRTSEALRENLRVVKTQLDGLKNKWVAEKGQLLDEKTAPEDAANQLNAQVLDVREEITRVSEAKRDGEKKRISALEVSPSFCCLVQTTNSFIGTQQS
jgi:hypothetical protein